MQNADFRRQNEQPPEGRSAAISFLYSFSFKVPTLTAAYVTEPAQLERLEKGFWSLAFQLIPNSQSLAPVSLRKEVIQPQLPLRLPCYDFVPVTSPTFDGALLAVRLPASGVTSSHDVTGGVYKARERIQRTIADARLLATPASCRRVAACNLN